MPHAMAQDISRPNFPQSISELAAPLSWIAGLRHTPLLANAPKGDGRPVVLVPGYLAGDSSMKPLQFFLKRLDYATHLSKIGIISGDIDKNVEQLGVRLQSIQSKHKDAPITINWLEPRRRYRQRNRKIVS